MKKLMSFFVILAVLFSLASCKPKGQKVDDVYKGEGTFDSEAVQAVEINDLIKIPDKYAGSFVSIIGKIVTECSVGCWFYMEDESGNQVHVDLAAQNFNIPQTVGRKVKVTGIYQFGEASQKVSAYEVEFIK